MVLTTFMPRQLMPCRLQLEVYQVEKRKKAHNALRLHLNTHQRRPIHCVALPRALLPQQRLKLSACLLWAPPEQRLALPHELRLCCPLVVNVFHVGALVKRATGSGGVRAARAQLVVRQHRVGHCLGEKKRLWECMMIMTMLWTMVTMLMWTMVTMVCLHLMFVRVCKCDRSRACIEEPMGLEKAISTQTHNPPCMCTSRVTPFVITETSLRKSRVLCLHPRSTQVCRAHNFFATLMKLFQVVKQKLFNILSLT